MTKKQLSLREQAKAIASVATLSFRTSPLAVLFKFVGAILDAGLPLITAYFAALTTTALVGAFSGNQVAGNQAVVYVIITSALGLVMTVWRSLDQYVQAKMRYVVEARVSDSMYDQFLNLDFWRYDDKETADLYDRAKRFASFFAYVFDRLASLLAQLITIVFSIVAMATLNVWVALGLFVALAPGVYLQFKLSREQVKHWNENVETRRARNLIEWDMIHPEKIAEIRLYGLVGHLMQLRNMYREKDEFERIQFERKYISKRLGADVLEFLLQVASLIWIVMEIIGRRQPVGQFIYVQTVVERAINGANQFVSTLASLDEDLANLFDYQEFMKMPRRKGGKVVLTSPPKKIELQQVSFRYHGENTPEVLRDISLTIKHEQHVAFVGENGAGKTTLIKLLAGLYEPTSGKILIDGIPLHDIELASWHRQLGILGQEFIRYSFATAGDNVRFGDVVRANDSIEDALEQAEATKFVGKLPKGEQTYVDNWMEDDEGNKGTELSGGQWQRLALARNFFRDAPVIILDEPTSAIDALAEARIFERLFKRTNKTIITISHRVTTLEKADRIYMFENGHLVEQGTHKDLAKADGAYSHLFAAQLKSKA